MGLFEFRPFREGVVSWGAMTSGSIVMGAMGIWFKLNVLDDALPYGDGLGVWDCLMLERWALTWVEMFCCMCGIEGKEPPFRLIAPEGLTEEAWVIFFPGEIWGVIFITGEPCRLCAAGDIVLPCISPRIGTVASEIDTCGCDITGPPIVTADVIVFCVEALCTTPPGGGCHVNDVTNGLALDFFGGLTTGAEMGTDSTCCITIGASPPPRDGGLTGAGAEVVGSVFCGCVLELVRSNPVRMSPPSPPPVECEDTPLFVAPLCVGFVFCFSICLLSIARKAFPSATGGWAVISLVEFGPTNGASPVVGGGVFLVGGASSRWESVQLSGFASDTEEGIRLSGGVELRDVFIGGVGALFELDSPRDAIFETRTWGGWAWLAAVICEAGIGGACEVEVQGADTSLSSLIGGNKLIFWSVVASASSRAEEKQTWNTRRVR